MADLPQGMVVLPGLDLGMAGEEWEALGSVKPDPEKPGERPLETHPQYHLKLLLGRMGIARDEVGEWTAASPFDGPDARAPFLSLLFAPAAYTARWQAADDVAPSLTGVSAAVFADDGQEGAGHRADDAVHFGRTGAHRRAGDPRPPARRACRRGARTLGHRGR